MPDHTPTRSGRALARPGKVLPVPETKLKLWVRPPSTGTRSIPRFGVTPVNWLGMCDAYPGQPAYNGEAHTHYRIETLLGRVTCFAINIGNEISLDAGEHPVIGTFDLATALPRYALVREASRSLIGGLTPYFADHMPMGMLPSMSGSSSLTNNQADFTLYPHLPGFRVHSARTNHNSQPDGYLRVPVWQDETVELWGKVKYLPTRVLDTDMRHWKVDFWPCDSAGTLVYDGLGDAPELLFTARIMQANSSPTRYDCREPNMPVGSVFRYRVNGSWCHVSEYNGLWVIDPPMDDPVGTRKLWAPPNTLYPLAAIPAGWRQVANSFNKLIVTSDADGSGPHFTSGSGSMGSLQMILIERYQ